MLLATTTLLWIFLFVCAIWLDGRCWRMQAAGAWSQWGFEELTMSVYHTLLMQLNLSLALSCFCLEHTVSPPRIKLQPRAIIGERCGLSTADASICLAETFRSCLISCDASFLDDTAQRQLLSLFQYFGVFSAFMYDSCSQVLTLFSLKGAHSSNSTSFLQLSPSKK